jgi:hypothetical protein
MILAACRRLLFEMSAKRARQNMSARLPRLARPLIEGPGGILTREDFGHRLGDLLAIRSPAGSSPMPAEQLAAFLACWPASGIPPQTLALVAILTRDKALALAACERGGADLERLATPEDIDAARPFFRTGAAGECGPGPLSPPPSLLRLFEAVASDLGHGAAETLGAIRAHGEAIGLAAHATPRSPVATARPARHRL